MEDYLKLYTINNQISDLVLINRADNNRSQSKKKEDIFNSYELKEESIYDKVKITKPRKGFGKAIHWNDIFWSFNNILSWVYQMRLKAC